ncbi:hypothetical protein NE237_020703 [Protea cynaroides]|uniref:Uncharacterized protein n=1 Tax=Protea cynaroides TaxID=273540 RepID=A0A9Q0H756_9MAGN|nr:hypothetical protein NE237_020703 [Protea cynaroides]
MPCSACWSSCVSGRNSMNVTKGVVLRLAKGLCSRVVTMVEQEMMPSQGDDGGAGDDAISGIAEILVSSLDTVQFETVSPFQVAPTPRKSMKVGGGGGGAKLPSKWLVALSSATESDDASATETWDADVVES